MIEEVCLAAMIAASWAVCRTGPLESAFWCLRSCRASEVDLKSPGNTRGKDSGVRMIRPEAVAERCVIALEETLTMDGRPESCMVSVAMGAASDILLGGEVLVTIGANTHIITIQSKI